ncbi:MAG: hypothetical protein HC869_11780 [Rhodospirillales bacterium]|nr:hypothetical protein [Rhodospirillales bacterium]
MAHILEFRSNAERAEIACEAMHQHSAQIIIFPGVRIERHAEVMDEPQAKPRRRERVRLKRDRLELPD